MDSMFFKKCKINLKIILHMSNIHIRDLTKRDYHGIGPPMTASDVKKTPIKQDFFNQWDPTLCYHKKVFSTTKLRIKSHGDLYRCGSL